MKTLVFHNWLIASETPPGRRIKSRHKMTREEALARDPTATPIPGSEEERLVPETAEERESLTHSQRKPLA